MPIYVYRCPNQHETEVIVLRGAQPDFTPCDICGAVGLPVPTAANYGGFTPPSESPTSRAIKRVRALKT